MQFHSPYLLLLSYFFFLISLSLLKLLVYSLRDLVVREQVSGRPWQSYLVDGQVAGYLTKWKDTKMAFATVHGAGHEVPTYKPEAALYLWQSYLNGELTDA